MARGKRYRVLTGMNYPLRRAEAGDIVDDIPAGSVAWLLADGHIEEADKDAPLSEQRPEGDVIYVPLSAEPVKDAKVVVA